MNTSLLPETIYRIDSNSSLVGEWASEFKDYPSIIPLDEDYFCKPADCIVSPANSFSIGCLYAIGTYQSWEILGAKKT